MENRSLSSSWEPALGLSGGFGCEPQLREGTKWTCGLMLQKRNAITHLFPEKRNRGLFCHRLHRVETRTGIGFHRRLNLMRQEVLDGNHGYFRKNTANHRRDGDLRAWNVCARSGRIAFLQRKTHDYFRCGGKNSFRYALRKGSVSGRVRIGHVRRSLHTPWQKRLRVPSRWPA